MLLNLRRAEQARLYGDVHNVILKPISLNESDANQSQKNQYFSGVVSRAFQGSTIEFADDEISPCMADWRSGIRRMGSTIAAQYPLVIALRELTQYCSWKRCISP